MRRLEGEMKIRLIPLLLFSFVFHSKYRLGFTALLVVEVFAHPTFAEEGFSSLFDGKTLNGWVTTRSTDAFSVNKEEKAIHAYAGKKKWIGASTWLFSN